METALRLFVLLQISRRKFASLGFGSGGQCGDDFGAIIRKDYANYGHTIHEARLQMQ
jgi:hypothetical protein